jgi:protein-tyrosine phosphatase
MAVSGRSVVVPVIDLHSHVLPGIDDGPPTIEGSVSLARAAVAAGIETLVATPHVSARYPNQAAAIARLVEETAARLREEEIALELRGGAEIAMTRLAEIEPARLGDLGLGGGPWLLIEPPFTPVATGLDAIVEDLLDRGHRVVLAHPERCPAFHRDPPMLERLVGAGVLTSLTAGSLSGRFGGEARRFALGLLERDLAHNVASDAHDDIRRPPGIAGELEQAGYGPLREWLTGEVPAAILAGEEIPSRPPIATPRRARGGWLRR